MTGLARPTAASAAAIAITASSIGTANAVVTKETALIQVTVAEQTTFTVANGYDLPAGKACETVDAPIDVAGDSGDISASFQAKLLRVLQEKEFERVGGSTPIKVDVRMVLATNRNLEKMVANGEFRADLYYRINVVSISLPPLRDRREDIPLMVEHFLSRFNRENSRSVKVTPRGLKVLTSCYWPGNVRELENCVERTATMAVNDELTDLSFPCHDNRCLTQVLHHVEREDAVRPGRPVNVPIAAAPPREAMPSSQGAGNPMHQPAHPVQPAAGIDDKPDGERERLIWAMEKCGWVQAKAARLLNITPRQMGYALQKYDIEVRKF